VLGEPCRDTDASDGSIADELRQRDCIGYPRVLPIVHRLIMQCSKTTRDPFFIPVFAGDRSEHGYRNVLNTHTCFRPGAIEDR
jgi:hypothetical protein